MDNKINIISNSHLIFNSLNNDKLLHLFTLKPFNFNKDLVGNDEILLEYKKIEQIFNYNFRKVIRPIQNHTSIVKCIDENNIDDKCEADGLVTSLKGVALVTSLADCQGILLYDKKKEVIGNVHSGWKGTLNRIVKNAINLMIDKYNSNTSDIEVYICPSILRCCFEVEDDVRSMFLNEFKDIDISSYIQNSKDNNKKYFIDTIGINKEILLSLGIRKDNIICSNICTKCNSDIMHSYRAEKEMCGRNIALICLK